MRGRTKNNDVIILGAHCLKFSPCKQEIVKDIENCLRCGKCQIKSLVELSKEKGVKLHFASGGLMALEKIKDSKQAVIVAIACEDELLSGIFRAFPRKILGIVLERPKGPCKDTNFDFERLKKYIIFLLEKGKAP